jgi:hypothetical protein
MKIEKIISQHRRDFQALYTWGHCGFQEKQAGYDDVHFHQNVVPTIVCKQCGKAGEENYQPREPKYQTWEII